MWYGLGNGTLVLPNGDRYSGSLKAGLPEGRGRTDSKRGDLFEGEFVGGVRHGQGSLTLTSGDVYGALMKACRKLVVEI